MKNQENLTLVFEWFDQKQEVKEDKPVLLTGSRLLEQKFENIF